MTDNQSKHYNAAEATISAMDENESLWTDKAKVVQYKEAVENDLLAIEALEMVQTTDKTGLKKNKDQYKIDNGAKVFTVSQLVAAYAYDQHDDETRQAVLFPKSKLQYGTDNEIHNHWQTVFNIATGKVDDMVAANYDITTTQVSDIDGFMTALLDKGGKVTSAGSQKVAATQTMAQLFDKLAIDMDLLFQNQANIFANNVLYRETMENVIKLINTGVRHHALRVISVDSLMEQIRLVNAQVTVVELNLILKSSKRGVVTFKAADVPEGNYSITVELAGYVTQTINNIAVLNSGVKFVMVKLVKA